MTDAVFDFKAINRKFRRMEQKAEFEAKNPEPEIGWPWGVAVPYTCLSVYPIDPTQQSVES